MDASNSASGPHQPVLGDRNISMNPKETISDSNNQPRIEQGPSILQGQSNVKLKYSMSNVNLSMHESMSGNSTPTDNHPQDDNEEGENDETKSEPEQLPQPRQQTEQQQHPNGVIITTDESENAVPMKMAQLSYDKHVKNDSDNSSALHVSSPPSDAPSPPYAKPAQQQSQGLRRPVPQRKRGVELSSSSEEYEAPPTPEHDPACAAKAKRALSKSNDSIIRDGQAIVHEKNIDDSQYEELEKLEERKRNEMEKQQMKHDRYKNQFMRIPVAASELKDAHTVERDFNHDKPRLGRRASFIKGIQRAVSSVKIAEESSSEGGDRARSMSVQAQQRNVGGMQRTKSQRSGLNHTGAGGNGMDGGRGLERPRENVVGSGASGSKRQTIGNLGRIISLNRQKGGTTPGGLAAAAAAASSKNLHGPPSNASMSHSSMSQESFSQIRNKQESEHSQQYDGSGTDRPRLTTAGRYGNSGGGTGGTGGRASISQIGRMLSRGRPKSSMPLNAQNNVSQPDRPAGTRASLSNIGRALSMNRRKAAHQKEFPQPQGYGTGADGKEISPMSTSTVSAMSVDDSPLADRERTGADSGNVGGGGGGTARREARLSLRGAGKMFSLTRRNTAGVTDGDKTGTGLLKTAPSQRNSRQLISMSGVARSSSKRSVAGGGGSGAVTDGGSGGSGSKVDGRADKFVYSELTSSVIAESGLIGNGKHIRVAQIAMAEYSIPLNRDKWYVDLFTLSHNAIRRECIDFYDMLSALARCGNESSGTEYDKDVCEDDMNDLERWWTIAHSLFRCYFDMERRILLPWVDSAGGQEWEVQLALKKMRSLKDKLETLLGKVDRVWNEKTFKSVGEMYAMIYKAVDDFVPRMMNYFADQEVLLPAIIKEFYKKEHGMEIDKKIVAAFMTPGDDEDQQSSTSKHNLVSLVRWIPKSKHLRAWLGKYLTSSERSMYPTWYQMYDEQHASIVTHLRSRATTA